MSDPFLGEIRAFGFNFAPRDWALCNGQILAISQYTALYSLLGTTYGGNGQTTFGLPDLRGRVGIAFGQGSGLPSFSLGQSGGEVTHTLTAAEMPAHSHAVNDNSGPANTDSPADAFPASTAAAGGNSYSNGADGSTTMNAGMIATAGGGQAHNNMQPYLTLNYCISLAGIFPSRN